MESSSSSGSSSGTAANNDSAPFGGLYGDLLGAILFSIMLPFVTFKAVDAIMMDNAMAMSILDDNEHAATHIPHYRIELHTCAGGSVALCSGITSYFSYHIINDAKRIDNSENEPVKSKLYTRSAMMERLAQQWSYISFGALILSMIGLAVNNWPHVDEQTLPGHFVWNLVVATANLPHSYRTKAVMGAINLVTGLAIVILYPNIYPVETFAPILVVITVVYWIANYWVGKGGHRLGIVASPSVVTNGGDGGDSCNPNEANATNGSSKSSHTAIPYSSAPTVDELKKVSFSWETLRVQIAFGAVVCFLLHFIFSEVYAVMTTPGYFLTGSFNICQTGILGAAGFIASGALRNSFNSNSGDNGNSTDEADDKKEATLLMASMAFTASPTPMAVVDENRRVENCNPALEQLTSMAFARASQVDKDVLLETVLGQVHAHDVDRLQRLFDRAARNAPARTGEEDASSEADYEFVVQHKVLHVQVAPTSFDVGDAEEGTAIVPSFSLAGLRQMASSSQGRRKRRKPRFIVVVKEVTFDRALVRAVNESAARSNYGQSETLMKNMMTQISATMNATNMSMRSPAAAEY